MMRIHTRLPIHHDCIQHSKVGKITSFTAKKQVHSGRRTQINDNNLQQEMIQVLT